MDKYSLRTLKNVSYLTRLPLESNKNEIHCTINIHYRETRYYNQKTKLHTLV